MGIFTTASNKVLKAGLGLLTSKGYTRKYEGQLVRLPRSLFTGEGFAGEGSMPKVHRSKVHKARARALFVFNVLSP